MSPIAHASLAMITFAATGACASEGHGAHRHGASASTAAAIGVPGNPAHANRTVAIEMNDAMRFVPGRIDVRRGETVRFVVRNAGKIRHEMVIGTRADLKAHAALMRKFPEMEHAAPNQVTLDPGTAGEIVWKFSSARRVDFACLQPGHFEAGMAGHVAVN